MDVALRVAEQVTMMHDGRVIVEGTPDEIRANELVHDLYLGRGFTHERERPPLLAVEGLNAHYGSAHVLQDVSFELGERGGRGHRAQRHGEDDALRGDHGHQPAAGVRFGAVRGQGAGRQALAQDRRAGDRLRARRVAGSSRRSRSTSTCGWSRAGTAAAAGTPQRVYELFPRLAERKRNGGAQLSGGEQQMLAIGRALMLNPKLLIMDEPSEGLAPAIIEMLIETFRRLEEEGLRILLIEQNLGVATSLAERQLVMVGGEIAAETTATADRRRPGAAAPLPRRRAGRALTLSRSAVVVALAALLAAGCGGSSGPKGPPALVFVSVKEGDYAIYGADADGQARLPADRPSGRSLDARGPVLAERARPGRPTAARSRSRRTATAGRTSS